MASNSSDKDSDSFIRARNPEQKARRRQEVKDVAADLFLRVPYHEITMTTIAGQLQWSRANLYKYVTTKEEIFLDLYLDAYAAYMRDIRSAFFTSDRLFKETYRSIPAAADDAARISETHPLALRLFGLLAEIIESNVRFETLVDFKRNLARVDPALEAVFAALCPGSDVATQNIMMHMYLVQASGLFSLIKCGDLGREAMAVVKSPYYLTSFREMLADFFVNLVRGYNNEE